MIQTQADLCMQIIGIILGLIIAVFVIFIMFFIATAGLTKTPLLSKRDKYRVTVTNSNPAIGGKCMSKTYSDYDEAWSVFQSKCVWLNAMVFNQNQDNNVNLSGEAEDGYKITFEKL